MTKNLVVTSDLFGKLNQEKILGSSRFNTTNLSSSRKRRRSVYGEGLGSKKETLKIGNELDLSARMKEVEKRDGRLPDGIAEKINK
jgi:hypothetical protein